MRFDLELFIYNLASRCINLFIIKYMKFERSVDNVKKVENLKF